MNTKNLFLSLSMGMIMITGFATEKTKPSLNKKACKYVQQQIELVEKFHKLEEGYSLELISASKFLGELSSIKSKWSYECQSEVPISDVDVKTWKNWYKTNKHLLYWDNQLKVARVK